jgi:predicted phosphodiesterase
MTVSSTFWAQYNPSFVYIAGDLTDTAANEGQWEIFFNQKTPDQINANQMSDNYDSMMSSYVLSAVQGNHDNNTFANHINFAASGGTNITYAYTYGSAHFIMINFENTATLAAQQDFVREQVAYAKENGLWTIVGFHKSIYSGASHMSDSDVTAARNNWAPLFAELDVDVVLQGHDHVLSRGFVDAAGNNARDTQGEAMNYQKIGDRTYSSNKPSNAPLYYVGNCASTLKFYNTVGSYNYDLAAPDYGFLDINSARDAGHEQNPDGPRSLDSANSWLVYPTYTNITVTKDAITFNTYFFQYNAVTDVIVTDPFLYDSFTVTRALPKFTVKADAFVTKLNGNQNDLTITITNIYENGSEEVVAALTIQISNNAAGTYEVGGYKVYVDTKGNDQIRACYIAE